MRGTTHPRLQVLLVDSIVPGRNGRCPLPGARAKKNILIGNRILFTYTLQGYICDRTGLIGNLHFENLRISTFTKKATIALGGRRWTPKVRQGKGRQPRQDKVYTSNKKNKKNMEIT